jgi:hypothetical protein
MSISLMITGYLHSTVYLSKFLKGHRLHLWASRVQENPLSYDFCIASMTWEKVKAEFWLTDKILGDFSMQSSRKAPKPLIIRDVTQASLRKAIGVVPQDSVLFNTTIGYNIR